MILVAGATGMVGGETCRLLRKESRPVRAMVRATSDPAKVDRLRALGCDIVTADLTDAHSLTAACAGVSSVVSTVSAMPFSWNPPLNTVANVDRDGQKRLVDAAAASNVRHFVLVTFSRNIDRPFPLRDAKRAAEQHLRASGVPYTILRPSCFYEVWLSPAVGFDVAGRHVRIFGTGENRISYISFADVAAFAATVLGNSAAVGQGIELGGPEALTPLQVVAIYEKLAGTRLEVEHIPVQALEQQLAAAPDDMQRSFAALMLSCAAGDEIPMEETLRRFPLPLTSVADHASRTLAALAAPAGA